MHGLGWGSIHTLLRMSPLATPTCYHCACPGPTLWPITHPDSMGTSPRQSLANYSPRHQKGTGTANGHHTSGQHFRMLLHANPWTCAYHIAQNPSCTLLSIFTATIASIMIQLLVLGYSKTVAQPLPHWAVSDRQVDQIAAINATKGTNRNAAVLTVRGNCCCIEGARQLLYIAC